MWLPCEQIRIDYYNKYVKVFITGKLVFKAMFIWFFFIIKPNIIY